MMSPVYRARAVQPGTAMTAHGDQVRCHCGAGPFFASGAPSDHRPGDADPALQQIYLRVTQPTANSEEAIYLARNLFMPRRLVPRQAVMADFHIEFGIIIIACAFAAVPMLTWAITVTIKPMLDVRYIIPTVTIMWPVILSFGLWRLFFAEEESD